MANPDPAKIAAESYAKATDAYAKNQTAQGMAAAQVADKVAAPDPLEALLKKAQAGTITPAEQKQLNDGIAKRNGPAIAPSAVPPVKPAGTPAPVPLAAAPVIPPAPAIPSGEAARGARWKELDTKLRAGTITEAEKAELTALVKGAPEMQPGYVPLPSKEEAAKAIAEAKANGAIGYLDPQASTESLDTGGPAVYRDFPTEAPAETPAAPTPSAEAPAKKRSAVDDIIAGMKDETSKEGGPNIWDIIQAAAAGWNFQTPAYLERKKSKEAKAADIEKLSKTAQFEKALQDERLAAEGTRTDKDIAAREAIARIQAGQGIGTIPGATKGQQLGAGLLQGLGKK
jgi:hypothetical protein